MNKERRIPGPVDEEATSIGAAVHKTRDSLSQGTRSPGPVCGRAETVRDDELMNEVPESPLLPEVTESSPWKVFFVLLAVTVFVWLLTEIAATLIRAYLEEAAWVWIPLAILSICLLAVFVWGARRELRALRGVDALPERTRQIEAMVSAKNVSGLHEALAPTLGSLRKRHPALIRQFEEAATDRETAEEYLRQFDNIVLTQLDKEAARAVNNGVLTGSLAVVISPHPALDAFLVLWRARVLVRSVGEIYGLQPTGLSSIRLLKYAVTSAMIAATIEKSGEFAIAQAAEDITLTKTFQSVAEAAGTGYRLHRLGRITQQVCRPVPRQRFQKEGFWAESHS